MAVYWFLAGLLLASASQVHADYFSYHIGNSLTNDMLGGKLTDMSAQAGQSHNVGYHIRSSAFLAYTISAPTDVSVTPPEPYGTYGNALPNYQWDAVTLQPYKGWPNGSTLTSDVQAISSLINLTHTNPANSETQFFIYAAWPGISRLSGNTLEYEQQWLRTTSGTGSQPTILARDYFADLYGEMATAGYDVRMIPAGEVLYTLDQKMRAGEIEGFSSVAQLYRDDLHMNDLGKHLAASTAYATMFGSSPVGMAYTSTSMPVDDAQLRLMQETVWDVVQNSPYTGVPEPATMGLMGVVGLLLLRRCRRVA